MLTVSILLCTYNGAKFLAKQLDSIEYQSFKNWRLYVSDDGSDDHTLDILHAYQKKWGKEKISIVDGPRQGFSQNFLKLCLDSEIISDYYAFCDQDDIWLADKLSVAINRLLSFNNFLPALYCGRSTLISEEEVVLGVTQTLRLPKCFSNAILQNIASGNTMVFNRATKILLENGGPQRVPFHDWWVYIMVSGCGGTVFFDETPQILYRQHPSSSVGARRTLLARIARIKKVFRGELSDWYTANILALEGGPQQFLTSESRAKIKDFSKLRKSNLLTRIILFFRCRVYYQTLRGNLGLWLALLTGKL